MASSFSLSSLRYADGLLVAGASTLTAILCESLSWLLIYRTPTYKTLRSSIDRASKKLESMKSEDLKESSSSLSSKKSSSKSKKIDRVEAGLKESSRELSMAKFKSGAVVAAVLFVVFGLLNSLFEGRAVAKLPFEPVGFVMKMSHRGVPGTDPTDCSMAFLYFLCSISIRTNLQKLLGFAPPRGAAGAGLFPMPDPKAS
ncbi:Calcium load-activated calcium channel protein [Dioscorea alata]|nr:Calcium load-activated calcium channel protein [Dioscorea alata]